MKFDSGKIEAASSLPRFVAAAIDFGLAIVLSVFSSAIIQSTVKRSDSRVVETNALIQQNASSSHLAKYENGQYVSYTSDEYFEKTDDGYQIIDALSYFYTVYLAGDTAKASPGDIVSLNADETMVVEGIETTPRLYYTVEWFNANVLALPKEGQIAKYDYFSYQQTDGASDYTKVGTVNEKYIVETEGVSEVKATDEMVRFVYEAYKKAATNLYNQSYMVQYKAYIEGVNNLIVFLCRLFFVFVLFEILPLCLKKGKSLGKLFMKLSLVRPDGDPISRWQVIPRGLFVLAIPFVLYFIPNLFVQIGIVAALLITTIILYLVNKNSRMVLHDLFSQTVVIEDVEKPNNY